MTSEFNTRAHQKGVAGLQPSPKIEIKKKHFCRHDATNF